MKSAIRACIIMMLGLMMWRTDSQAQLQHPFDFLFEPSTVFVNPYTAGAPLYYYTDETGIIYVAQSKITRVGSKIPLGTVTSFCFIDDRQGWAVGTNGMLTTTDRGTSWRDLGHPP